MRRMSSFVAKCLNAAFRNESSSSFVANFFRSSFVANFFRSSLVATVLAVNSTNS